MRHPVGAQTLGRQAQAAHRPLATGYLSQRRQQRGSKARRRADSDCASWCLAGGKKDSWLIDYEATKNCLDVGRELGMQHFVLLSAICVQKPLLEFQRAKLKLEADLQVRVCVCVCVCSVRASKHAWGTLYACLYAAL